jgi:hypothetical protein
MTRSFSPAPFFPSGRPIDRYLNTYLHPRYHRPQLSNLHLSFPFPPNLTVCPEVATWHPLPAAVRRRRLPRAPGRPSARAERKSRPPPDNPPPLRPPTSETGPSNPSVDFPPSSLHSALWCLASEWTLRLSATGRVSTAPPNNSCCQAKPTSQLDSRSGLPSSLGLAYPLGALWSEAQLLSPPESGRKQ